MTTLVFMLTAFFKSVNDVNSQRNHKPESWIEDKQEKRFTFGVAVQVEARSHTNL